MMGKTRETEIREAVAAGERALTSLRRAQEKLDSARNWGLFDLFGGGFITDMIKHSRMNDASALMENARADLLVFQRELRDVCVPTEFRMEVSDFLTFADFFFDGVIADYLVQSKIAEARAQVSDAIYQVERLLRDLRGLQNCNG
ncbi:MAG: hypothetical protein ACLU9Q_12710 [Marvinbryantia sp.]|uniref:hypothetical protein n=1 Tax=Marvinbryantia sp. TaxID=2496532 RepID=UPI002ED18FC8